MQKRILVIISLLVYSNIGQAQKVIIDLGAIKSTIQKWSDAHNTNDSTAFSRLYTSQVTFYSKELSREECVKIKSERLGSGKYFHQEIIDDPTISVYDYGLIRCDFTKRIISGSNVRDYKSYLLLTPSSDLYSIAEESDLITDSRLAYTPRHGKKVDQSALEIIESSSVEGKMDQTVSSASSKKTNFPWSLAVTSIFMTVAFGIIFWLFSRKNVNTILKERKRKKHHK